MGCKCGDVSMNIIVVAQITLILACAITAHGAIKIMLKVNRSSKENRKRRSLYWVMGSRGDPGAHGT